MIKWDDPTRAVRSHPAAAPLKQGNMVAATVDSKGRVLLGREFAGKSVRITRVDEFEARIEVVETIPAREAWLWKNPAAMNAVREGMAQAAAGELVEGPNLNDPFLDACAEE